MIKHYVKLNNKSKYSRLNIENVLNKHKIIKDVFMLSNINLI